MWGRLTIIAMAAVVSGCGSTSNAGFEQSLAMAKGSYEAKTKACEARFPDPYKKPTVPRTACINEAFSEYAAAGPLANSGELLHMRAMGSQMLVLLERFDKGGYTPIEYKAAIEQTLAAYDAERQSRMRSEQLASSARQQAAAAWWMASKH